MAPAKKHTHTCTHTEYCFLVLLGENVLVVYNNKRLKVLQFIMSCINSLFCTSIIVFSHISVKKIFLLNASMHSCKKEKRRLNSLILKLQIKQRTYLQCTPILLKIQFYCFLLHAILNFFLFCTSTSFSLSIWNYYNLWRYLSNLDVQLVE